MGQMSAVVPIERMLANINLLKLLWTLTQIFAVVYALPLFDVLSVENQICVSFH